MNRNTDSQRRLVSITSKYTDNFILYAAELASFNVGLGGVPEAGLLKAGAYVRPMSVIVLVPATIIGWSLTRRGT